MKNCYICTECGKPCSLRNNEEDFAPRNCPYDSSIVPLWRVAGEHDGQSFQSALDRIRNVAEFAAPEYVKMLDEFSCDLRLALAELNCVIELDKQRQKSIQLVADVKEIIGEEA